ncbi:MAG: 2-amino-4-hydroxy-6-hydroxymethyldihydropteridine diphosphokinase [Candidatus Tokpelaia sp.]|uniref:2-amino-4-hydroxy-6- hydroxymethyldihydropteridine diphosphokinase n=1 Tax=Candidatus Tokpelaia sp. TaxID=2233777 RepID=UPI0012384424|nr:2-amino-4-hydroxy-6-hydroxymethyldihydropteridine diphosphokinase [Candidatus Tokpelaia sp.]KAA6204799.1 MAG: 2-amino-4-hydroxy-6-hydroxymethyldihydropteridine diphosphokinase [Candidatus Tokpelaia sp.]KAA6207624.1 MAG: 2-amino-4-hydroxy-6-hydroxymethyldihydropteridine diphosphokinase [Candidatus Tokpelaia sp.]KAA6404797.1 2-amino-4-hydroxy-6-hydroxymethyldihydropteridine diphosphokinase [Candidatus Tokpelaia sp.]
MRHATLYHKAWLGLGGNLGPVEENFRYALQNLAKNAACRIKAVSSLYRTQAWGKENQPDFLNACIMLETALTPQALLQVCLRLEREKKRERIEKWGPRSLDIDILFYEGYTSGGSDNNTLVLPHLYSAERPFTVIPLAEISPDLSLDGINFRQRAAVMRKNGQSRTVRKIAKSAYWYKL